MAMLCMLRSALAGVALYSASLIGVHSQALAFDFGERPIDSLYTGSETVAVVRIMGAETIDHGVIYRAVVDRALKGCDSGQVIFFGPYIWRKISARYLVFLNSTHIKLGTLLPKSLTGARNGRWPSNERILSERAYEGMGTLYIETKLVNERDPSTLSDWVEVPGNAFAIPNGMPVLDRDTCTVATNSSQNYWVKLESLISYFDAAKGWYPVRSDRDPQGVANSRFCSERFWSADIRARVVYQEDSIPRNVLSSIQEKLRRRLNGSAMARLRWMHALVLDTIPIKRRASIDTANPPRYRVVYSYSDSAAGLYQFCIAVESDSGGVVAQDPWFPRSVGSQKKSQIISLKKAIAIARKQGMHIDFSVSIDYSRERDALIWTFVWYDELSGTSRTQLLLDAHTGERLGLSTSEDYSFQ